MIEQDIERMLVCEICGGEACFGFGVTLDGLRMGDVGAWRCTDHHPDPARQIHYTREQWAAARAEGKFYPVAQPAAAPTRENAE